MNSLIRLHLAGIFFVVVSLLAACGGGGSSGGDSSTTPPAVTPPPPADTTPPTVFSKSPPANATGVPLNDSVSATFSEAMTNSTLTTALTLAPTAGGAAIAGTISVSGNTATLTPTVNLAASTQYTATVTTGAQDAAGNALAANVTWSFTTGVAPDTTQPTVVSSNLTNGQTGVSDTSKIFITFSEDMAPASLSPATTFTLAGPSGLVSGSVSYLTPTAAFVPTVALTGNTPYTATVTTGATDLAGNPLAAEFKLSFTTAIPTFRAFMTAPTAAGSRAGNLVLVNPSDPLATSTFAALVNTAENNDDARISYLPAGSYNATTKQVNELHRRAAIFANGGKIFSLSTVMTGTVPVPVQISNVNDITNGLGDGSAGAAATDLCQLFPLADFANADNSPVVLFQAGPDKTCFTNDDGARFFLFGDSAATAPTPFPAGFSLNVVTTLGNNIGTGAFDGLIAANTAGSLFRLSGPGLATQESVGGSPIAPVTSVEPVTQLNDGRTVLRLNKELRVYDPVANSIGAALVTLSQAQGVESASDGTNLFFTDNAAVATNVIQKLTFPAGTLNANFFTGAVGANIHLNAVTPTASGRLIFQENGTIKSIPKGSGAVATLVSPAGGPVIFVGMANGTPVRIYANVASNTFTGAPGSGTWTAKVVAEDGTLPASHTGDSRWIAGSFGATVNLFGNQRFVRQVLLLTRAVGAADDHAAIVASFNALTHAQLGNGAGTAVASTVPADVAYLGDSSNNSRTQFFAREEGGAKLLLQATYTSGTQPDVFFVDPLVGDSMVNVGGGTTTDIPLDFKDIFD